METDTKYKNNAHFFFSVYLLDVNCNFTDEFKYLQKTQLILRVNLEFFSS